MTTRPWFRPRRAWRRRDCFSRTTDQLQRPRQTVFGSVRNEGAVASRAGAAVTVVRRSAGMSRLREYSDLRACNGRRTPLTGPSPKPKYSGTTSILQDSQEVIALVTVDLPE